MSTPVKFAFLSALLLACLGASAAAEDMKPPQLSYAKVDWAEAVATLAGIDQLKPLATPLMSRAAHSMPRSLARLNNVMSPRFPGIATSPVPVLLPFETAALLRDQAAGDPGDGDDRYLSGFRAIRFFYPGPAGYDAAFAILAADIPELANDRFRDPIEVQISGSALLYDLDVPNASKGAPVPALEADFPGIRRQIMEHNLRYTFVRFGVPYVVSALCFDAGVPRFRMPTCRTADTIAVRFLRALQIAGGTPRQTPAAKPMAIERPDDVSDTFTYGSPGRLLRDTGFRGNGGRADYTVYSQIRFPIAEAPAYAGSQMYRLRNAVPGTVPGYSYPWRDNFCERRGFPVAQCPAGVGHQGQDIRPARCKPPEGSERCVDDAFLVAVRDGVIVRTAKQEAAYLLVNSASEHIRFRYLHMNPRKMDENNLLSGRRVFEGEVIGQVSNYSQKEGGTSYHLHFDVQVPTKDGWVFVNPYMTLVAAYERLLGERGVELGEPAVVSSADQESTASIGQSSRAERHRGRHSKLARHHGRSKHAKYGKHKKHRTRFASH